MKIVINTSWGDYPPEFNDDRLSEEVISLALKRDDVSVVEIPDNAFYHIFDYNGQESVIWSLSGLKFAERI